MAKKRYGNELHPLYSRWLSTTQRCKNPNHISYKNYGARGIILAPELEKFEDYCAYVMQLDGYDPKNASLDRINNDQGYEIGNLRWTTHSTQTANQRTSGKGFNKYLGVNWSKSHNRWVARVTYKGKNIFSRTFLTEQDALKARNQFIIENGLPHTIQHWSK